MTLLKKIQKEDETTTGITTRGETATLCAEKHRSQKFSKDFRFADIVRMYRASECFILPIRASQTNDHYRFEFIEYKRSD